MNRKALARRAYNLAADRACASLTGQARQDKLRRLREAHEARQDRIDLAAFLGFHRLDRILANLSREHAEGRVGSTPVHQTERAA